jgi:hypothetical protein
MDTFTFMMIRLAIFAAMVALWLAAIGVHAYFRRRRISPTSPAPMLDGAARGPAANAATGPGPVEEAA